VKVRSGDDWETGFVFGTRRHVIASRFVANESSSLEILDADQKVHEATVVAWSEPDDLVLLELSEDIAAPPLQAAPEPPWVPQAMVVLYQPRETDGDSRAAKTWSVPIALPGTVARIFPAELDIDVNLWGRPGDYGAPVLTQTGQVIGVVSQHGSEKRRTIAARVERATRLFALRGKQGKFSRTHKVTSFGGFQFTPIAAKHTVGGGLVVGLAYDWFAFEGLVGFYERGYRPIDDTQSEALTRLQSELYAEVQIKIDRGWFFFGSSVQFNNDFFNRLVSVAGGTLSDVYSEGHILPGGTVGLVGSILFYRLDISAEPRFDIGMILGR
jgi:hypothetical protein